MPTSTGCHVASCTSGWTSGAVRCGYSGDTILEATYAWFTEGFDTGDLREAKALLEVLA